MIRTLVGELGAVNEKIGRPFEVIAHSVWHPVDELVKDPREPPRIVELEPRRALEGDLRKVLRQGVEARDAVLFELGGPGDVLVRDRLGRGEDQGVGFGLDLDPLDRGVLDGRLHDAHGCAAAYDETRHVEVAELGTESLVVTDPGHVLQGALGNIR